MLRWAFRFPFWGLMLAALFRAIFYVATFNATTGLADSRYRTLSPYLIIQGTIGCSFGFYYLWKSHSKFFEVNGRRNNYLWLGLLNVGTTVLPIIGYWIGIPFKILQVVSLPILAILQGGYSLAKGHYQLETSHIRTVAALFFVVALIGLDGDQIDFRPVWFLIAGGLGIIQLYRDQMSRHLKLSHIDRESNANDQPYVQALGENFLFTGIPLIPAGILAPFVIKFVKPSVDVTPVTDLTFYAIAGVGCLFICLALRVEIWIQKEKGGFRETCTGTLGRISFLAVIQQIFGSAIPLTSLYLGLGIAFAGLADEWRKFEERRRRKGL